MFNARKMPSAALAASIASANSAAEDPRPRTHHSKAPNTAPQASTRKTPPIQVKEAPKSASERVSRLPKASSSSASTTQCSNCSRSFSNDALERHEPICVKLQAKSSKSSQLSSHDLQKQQQQEMLRKRLLFHRK